VNVPFQEQHIPAPAAGALKGAIAHERAILIRAVACESYMKNVILVRFIIIVGWSRTGSPTITIIIIVGWSC
jgi:hypothetical protein